MSGNGNRNRSKTRNRVSMYFNGIFLGNRNKSDVGQADVRFDVAEIWVRGVEPNPRITIYTYMKLPPAAAEQVTDNFENDDMLLFKHRGDIMGNDAYLKTGSLDVHPDNLLVVGLQTTDGISGHELDKHIQEAIKEEKSERFLIKNF